MPGLGPTDLLHQTQCRAGWKRQVSFGFILLPSSSDLPCSKLGTWGEGSALEVGKVKRGRGEVVWTIRTVPNA